MSANAAKIAEYLRRYVDAYRREYERLTSPTPAGGGYPALEVSPFLYARELVCLLSPDGTAIVDESREPPVQWWIAGGPALMADFPESRTPVEVIEFLKQEGLWGQFIGIYRLVSQQGIPESVWSGKIPEPDEEVQVAVGETSVVVRKVNLPHLEVLRRLTFGTLGLIIDVHLGGPDADFWTPHIVRQLGFLTADRRHRRFLNYLELSPHTDLAAWDERSIGARVQADVRRDFGWAFSLPEQRGATISLGAGESWIQPYIQPSYDHLSRLAGAITAFATLLEQHEAEQESFVHQFLTANPVLLDIYGEPISKPRFEYPEGESPLGKVYVEPDFIVRYPGNSYKLVELEQPSKQIATGAGQPRAEVTQATFQIAEWRAYIANHYDRIKTRFPGIALNHTAMVVISRSRAESFGTRRDVARYKELLKAQYPDVEIVTYDDLLDRARQAHIRLSSLGLPRRNAAKL